MLQRRKVQSRTLALGCTVVAAAFVAYKAHRSGYFVAAQKSCTNITTTVTRWLGILSTSSELLYLLSSDLLNFLQTDADEVPQSFKQILKLLQATETQTTISSTSSSLFQGLFAGAGKHFGPSFAQSSIDQSIGPSVWEQMLNALLSSKGQTLVSVAVGSATRNAVEAFFKSCQAYTSTSISFTPQDALDLVASPQGERLLTLLVTNSLRTLVHAYVESSDGYNCYNDLFEALSKTSHKEAVAELITRSTEVFCKELSKACFGNPQAAGEVGATRMVDSTSIHDHSGDNQVWLRPVVQLAGAPEVRSLALDCVRTGSTQATKEAALILGRGFSSAFHSSLSLPASNVYVVVSVVFTLAMYLSCSHSIIS